MPHRRLIPSLLLLATALLLGACEAGDDAAAPGETAATEVGPGEAVPDPGDAEPTLVADLEPGDCFVALSGQTGTQPIAEVAEVLVVPCEETHDAEVFARADLPERMEVTSPQLDAAGGAACLEDGGFADYAGRELDEQEGLEVASLRPVTEEGDTLSEVVCAVYRPVAQPTDAEEDAGEEDTGERGVPAVRQVEPKQGSIRDGASTDE